MLSMMELSCGRPQWGTFKTNVRTYQPTKRISRKSNSRRGRNYGVNFRNTGKSQNAVSFDAKEESDPLVLYHNILSLDDLNTMNLRNTSE